MAHRNAIVSALIAVGVLGGSWSTVGAASEGAVVIRQRECAPFEAGELCTTLRMTSNLARTRWGYSSTAHGTSTATYTEDGVVRWTAEQKYRGHLLVKHGEIAEERFSLVDMSNRTGLTCTITTRLHSTNGKVQYQVDSYVCTP